LRRSMNKTIHCIFAAVILSLVFPSCIQTIELEEKEVSILQTRTDLPLHATVTKSQLFIGSQNDGAINVEVFSVNGQKVLSKEVNASNAAVSLAKLSRGSYLIVISQDGRQLNIKWNKAEK